MKHGKTYKQTLPGISARSQSKIRESWTGTSRLLVADQVSNRSAYIVPTTSISKTSRSKRVVIGVRSWRKREFAVTSNDISQTMICLNKEACTQQNFASKPHATRSQRARSERPSIIWHHFPRIKTTNAFWTKMPRSGLSEMRGK